ncbi:hypothetical protein SAMN06265373_103381 [Shimia sagamensis]|uniref:Uncharacterized protein n=1 Tax=Shimia sagamensis TaxID=1566352 RepID=A0ABY1NUY7_9RHOB|nr:hypothetical protein SAMN06265373_103381 [Shimia sagamensis]
MPPAVLCKQKTCQLSFQFANPVLKALELILHLGP